MVADEASNTDWARAQRRPSPKTGPAVPAKESTRSCCNVPAGSWVLAGAAGEVANDSGVVTGILASATLAASPGQATCRTPDGSDK